MRVNNCTEVVSSLLSACKRITGSAPAPILDKYVDRRESVDVVRDCVKCYNKNFASMKYEEVLRAGGVMLGKRVDLSRLFLAATRDDCRASLVCAFLRVIVHSSSVTLTGISPIPAKHIVAARKYVEEEEAREYSSSSTDSSSESSSSSSSDSGEAKRTAEKMMEILSNLKANIAGSVATADSIVLPAGISLGPEYMSPTKTECMDWLEGITAIEGALVKRVRGDGGEDDTSSSSQ